MQKLKKFFKIFLFTLAILVFMAFGWSWWISYSAKKNIYSIPDLPQRHVGVLLGTSKYLVGGKRNLYYSYRIEAAAQLYASGYIDYLLVSGDNATMQYNEPTTMMKDLVAAGVPKERIVLDYAGFRTLDSMVRTKEVFGQKKVVVISQRFHVERALFLAKAHGLDAVGYCAQDVSAYYGFKTRLREFFARSKVFLDLYITRKKPKFLGEPVVIPEGD